MVLSVLTLAVLVGQLVVFWRQAAIMNAQAGLLKAQNDLAKQQAEWRRDEAIGTFYRLAHDLVAEFRKATVLPSTPIPADYGTHPRLMLREASRLFAPLGTAFVLAVNGAALRLDDYFSAVEAYNRDPRGRDGAARWQTAQALREQVGADLDEASRHLPPELRWRYSDHTDYNFKKLSSLPPGIVGESEPVKADDLSQLQWLGQDIPEFRRLIESAMPSFAERLGDVTDADRHAKYLVVADLTWRVWYLGIGIDVLLEEELYSPAIVLARSLWEAISTLAYLVKHQRFGDEAVILLAFSYQQMVKQFAHQPELVKQRTEILARMPPNLVGEARERAGRKPFTWSGLNARKVAEAGGVTGYAEAYGFFSSETHGTLVGENVKVLAPPEGETKGRIKFGRDPGPKDVESLANFARRALHGAFKTMWQVFDAPRVQVRTPDPEVWRKAAGQPPSQSGQTEVTGG